MRAISSVIKHSLKFVPATYRAEVRTESELSVIRKIAAPIRRLEAHRDLSGSLRAL
jgi:hypothetical protein